MACNHKTTASIVGVWPKKDKLHLASENCALVILCRACGAMRIDYFNDFIYQHGSWSAKNPKTVDVAKNI